ncbi:MAG: FxLYD domain-containing protein [Candidatus Yanofskybacteria bacterium]|nr:FxLYD domain-containing protein [Candidatus Yanofskybacteria bacterium]
MSRFGKQIIIAVIFLIFFSSVGYGIYSLATENPTCFDGKQNQGEEGVDCGAVCGILCDPETQPLEIISSQIIQTQDQEYDFIAFIQNPNTAYGVSELSYEIRFLNPSHVEVARRGGKFYIQPGQTRYIVEQAIESEDSIVSAELRFENPQWQKIEGEKTAIDFPLKSEQYQDIGSAPVYSQFEGVISNNSNFDLDRVDVTVLLLDQAEAVVGVNTTVIRTLPARTERYFKVTWPFKVPGTVARTRVIATTDVLNSSNFLKSDGSQEKFQDF